MRAGTFLRNLLGVALVVELGTSAGFGQIVNLNDINVGDQSDNNVQEVQTFSRDSLGNDAYEINAVANGTNRKPVLPEPIMMADGRIVWIPFPIGTLLDNILLAVREGPEQDKTTGEFFARYDFIENNSFIGKGVLDTQQSDVGFDFQTPFGMEIIPFFTYGHATDRTNVSDMSANTYGGTLSISQKILPFVGDYPNHPKATEAFGNDVGYADLRSLYPRFDLKGGLDLTFSDAEKYTYKSGAGSPLSQDGYLISPNVTFDMYLSPKWVVSIIPTWTYNLSSTDAGESGSSGLFAVQDRNAYTVFAKTISENSKTKINESLLLYEFNILERDTNIEPLPPAAYNGYQTWAKFGVGVNYLFDQKWTFKATYTYEAFNKLYEAHYVTASLNYKFW